MPSSDENFLNELVAINFNFNSKRTEFCRNFFSKVAICQFYQFWSGSQKISKHSSRELRSYLWKLLLLLLLLFLLVLVLLLSLRAIAWWKCLVNLFPFFRVIYQASWPLMKLLSGDSAINFFVPILMLVELPGDALPEVDICTLEPPVGKAKFQTVYSPLTNIKIQTTHICITRSSQAVFHPRTFLAQCCLNFCVQMALPVLRVMNML